MQSKETTVEAYMAQLPDERKAAMEQLRALITQHLPVGFKKKCPMA